MKRLNILLLLTALAVILLSNGRIPSITDKSIVHAIAVDKGESGLSVTLQIFKPEAAGADTPIDISKANFKLITAEGRDMEQCLSRLSDKAGGELFLGHLQMLVLGEDIEFDDISELVSPLRNDKSIYPGLYLACAKNAAETVAFPIKENAVTAENYRRIIENAAARGRAFPARLIDIDNCLAVSGTLAMPYLEIEGKKGQESLDVTGSRLLTQKGFTGDKLTCEECSYLSLLRDVHTDLALARETELDGRTLHLTDIDRDISFGNKDGRLLCCITVKANAEEHSGSLDGLSEACGEGLVSALEKYLKYENTDPPRLFEQLRLKKPALYAKYRDRLYELYDDTEFEVSVSIYD